MFRFIARRIPRFRLSTLIAWMLLVVSIGGAVRIGFGPDAEAAAALQALEDEGLAYSAHRPFTGKADATTLSADAWNPFRRFAHWMLGHEDRVVTISVSGWPSDEAREELFDLPHVLEIALKPPSAEGRAAGPGKVPTPEEIVERPLPDFANDDALPTEGPPIPSGVPLSDEERGELFRVLEQRARAPLEYQGERFLCRAESTDFRGFTLVTASDGESSWQLRYRQVDSKATAKTDLDTPRGRALRQWDKEWQTYEAFRVPEGDRNVYIHPAIETGFPNNQLLRAHLFRNDADDACKSVERLEDGTIALHFRPRELWSANPPQTGSVTLVEGVLIVDPQHDYAIRRFDYVQDNGISGDTWTSRHAFEYQKVDGHHVPVRCLAWTDSPPRTFEEGVIPGGPHASVTRYAWDFDPDLPVSLFEFPNERGEFFTATPATRRFQWWYVTGGVAIVWLYFVISRGIMRRLRQANPSKIGREDSPIAIAESAEAS